MFGKIKQLVIAVVIAAVFWMLGGGNFNELFKKIINTNHTSGQTTSSNNTHNSSHNKNTMIAGTVTKVSDGDTIHVRSKDGRTYKIRLQGIDAPESMQKFGKASMRALASCLRNKKAVVEWRKKDQYGRLIAVVYSKHNGKLVDCNLSQVQRGMAYHYKHYQRDQQPKHRKQYAQAETAAQQKNIGVWSDNSVMFPWEYRKLQKSN